MSDRPFKVQGINHIGIAAKDTAKAKEFFTEKLGERSGSASLKLALWDNSQDQSLLQ